MTSGTAYEFVTDYSQESLGSIADTCNAPFNMDNMSMLRNVLESTESIEDHALRIKTSNFIRLLTYYVGQSGIEFRLPRLVTDFKETDSYLEWVFPHFTIGFNISSDVDQDGWFVLTDDTLGHSKKTYYEPIPLDNVVAFVERYGDS